MTTQHVSGDLQTIIRSKTSENGRERSSLPIPMDVIMEIFTRLPLKSIAICRCVSKLWASMLRLPDFTELFLTKSFARPKLLFARQKRGQLLFFSSPQPQNPDENSSPPVAAKPLMHFSGFTFDSSCKISGLVHGLVCHIYKRISKGKKHRVPVICNPSTGQALVLANVKTRRTKVRSFLGYDPIDKNFKVLSMTQPMHGGDDVVCEEHQVLTLGTGNMSWRRIQCCLRHVYPREEICINGVLYYTSMNISDMIVCFDIRSEKFSSLQVKETLGRAVLFGNLINFNGKLGLILSEDNEGNVGVIDRRSTRFILWVLEDLEKQEWSEHIYVLPASWKNIVEKHFLKFVGVTRTNEIVLSIMCPFYWFYLFYFNPKRNTVVRVEIQGMDVRIYTVLQTFLDHVEDVKLYASV